MVERQNQLQQEQVENHSHRTQYQRQVQEDAHDKLVKKNQSALSF